ncbi:MAG TPA: histidine kinase [Gaiellaceae bacterium]
MIGTFRRTYGELCFVFALGALAQLELWLDAEWDDVSRRLAPLALAMTAILLLRLRAPLLTLVLESACLVLLGVLNTSDGNDPMGMIIIALVAIYSAGAHTRGRPLAAASVLALANAVAAAIYDGDSMNVSGFLFFGLFVFGPFLAGVVIRIRREREHLLVQERDERARAAVAEERTRIARELHDVVAHAMGVIVLQARGARHALDDAPEDARDAIDAIESTAGGALAEMRRLLGVLREDGEEIALAPQPSLEHLDVLAAKLRDAGLPVEVTVEGDRRELPPGVDLSAYRIAQEALTNALKHAGPARAHVHLRYRPDHVEVEVLDDGGGSGSGNGSGSGHGLLGMRERVTVFGGELETGPRDGGGYAVKARLPL